MQPDEDELNLSQKKSLENEKNNNENEKASKEVQSDNKNKTEAKEEKEENKQEEPLKVAADFKLPRFMKKVYKTKFIKSDKITFLKK
jgi:hypothetical protein